MNASIKSAIKIPNSCCFQIRSAFFHSTPFLEKGRRNNWNKSSDNNSFGRYRRKRNKGDKLKDASAFFSNMYKGWDSDGQPPNNGPSWFNGTNNGQRKNHFQSTQSKGKRGFTFCEEDDDVETIFRTAFGDRFFMWSIDEDYPYGKRSSQKSNSYKASWKYQSEDEYEYYTAEDNSWKSFSDDPPKSHLGPERTALGLSASGPLKLEDVKTAYRASALKWHPDRHQGTSKIDAEEKFKHCTAAYQSLCESFAVN